MRYVAFRRTTTRSREPGGARRARSRRGEVAAIANLAGGGRQRVDRYRNEAAPPTLFSMLVITPFADRFTFHTDAGASAARIQEHPRPHRVRGQVFLGDPVLTLPLLQKITGSSLAAPTP